MEVETGPQRAIGVGTRLVARKKLAPKLATRSGRIYYEIEIDPDGFSSGNKAIAVRQYLAHGVDTCVSYNLYAGAARRIEQHSEQHATPDPKPVSPASERGIADIENRPAGDGVMSPDRCQSTGKPFGFIQQAKFAKNHLSGWLDDQTRA